MDSEADRLMIRFTAEASDNAMYQVEWFRELDDDVADQKLIGAFSTLEKAQEALEHAATLPGFRDFPDCLSVGRIDVNKDHWTDGFFTPGD